ncbi:hypothetical protein HDE_08567 [Halotydeus destructor]|nr:hypothetical protein HDE_08567 [Halotydeus destructor]
MKHFNFFLFVLISTSLISRSDTAQGEKVDGTSTGVDVPSPRLTYQFWEIQKQQFELLVKTKVWLVETVWRTKIWLVKLIVTLLNRILSIVGLDFFTSSEMNFLQHNAFSYNQLAVPFPAVQMNNPMASNQYSQQQPYPAPGIHVPAASAFPEQFSYPNVQMAPGQLPNVQLPPFQHYNQGYQQLPLSPINQWLTQNMSTPYPVLNATQPEVTSMPPTSTQTPVQVKPISDSPPEKPFDSMPELDETGEDYNLTDHEAQLIAMQPFGEVRSSSISFFNWLIISINWIAAKLWFVLMLPILIVLEACKLQLWLLREAFFKIIGYNTILCRQRFICSISALISSRIPNSVFNYLYPYVGIILSLGALSSEYFDAALTGFMNFNCTDIYSDPAC